MTKALTAVKGSQQKKFQKKKKRKPLKRVAGNVLEKEGNIATKSTGK